MTLRRLCLCLVLLAGVAGCGKKGPLYLPEPAPDADRVAPRPAP